MIFPISLCLQARYCWGLLLYLLTVAVPSIENLDLENPLKCGQNSHNFKYMFGDALTDSADRIGPNNAPYPMLVVLEFNFTFTPYFCF